MENNFELKKNNEVPDPIHFGSGEKIVPLKPPNSEIPPWELPEKNKENEGKEIKGFRPPIAKIPPWEMLGEDKKDGHIRGFKLLTPESPPRELPHKYPQDYIELSKEQIALGKVLIKLFKFLEKNGATIIIDGDIDKLPPELRREIPSHWIKDNEKKVSINRFAGRNDDLVGRLHQKTDVPFIEKEVVDPTTGKLEKHSFPVFDSKFDAQLTPDLYKKSDAEQVAECNRQLKIVLAENPSLADEFKPMQLKQIENNKTPKGYTWHHNEDIGKMQLVDTKTHAETGHVGGRLIWGGGIENRKEIGSENHE